jgi:hypothetical protein
VSRLGGRVARKRRLEREAEEHRRRLDAAPRPVRKAVAARPQTVLGVLLSLAAIGDGGPWSEPAP